MSFCNYFCVMSYLYISIVNMTNFFLFSQFVFFCPRTSRTISGIHVRWWQATALLINPHCVTLIFSLTPVVFGCSQFIAQLRFPFRWYSAGPSAVLLSACNRVYVTRLDNIALMYVTSCFLSKFSLRQF